MRLFGKRQDADADLRLRLAHLEERAGRIESALRQFQIEAESLHAEVRKWMRRAVAAERSAERRAGAAEGTTAADPPTRRALWGARARRAARDSGQPIVNGEGEGDGVHS